MKEILLILKEWSSLSSHNPNIKAVHLLWTPNYYKQLYTDVNTDNYIIVNIFR